MEAESTLLPLLPQGILIVMEKVIPPNTPIEQVYAEASEGSLCPGREVKPVTSALWGGLTWRLTGSALGQGLQPPNPSTTCKIGLVCEGFAVVPSGWSKGSWT